MEETLDWCQPLRSKENNSALKTNNKSLRLKVPHYSEKICQYVLTKVVRYHSYCETVKLRGDEFSRDPAYPENPQPQDFPPIIGLSAVGQSAINFYVKELQTVFQVLLTSQVSIPHQLCPMCEMPLAGYSYLLSCCKCEALYHPLCIEQLSNGCPKQKTPINPKRIINCCQCQWQYGLKDDYHTNIQRDWTIYWFDRYKIRKSLRDAQLFLPTLKLRCNLLHANAQKALEQMGTLEKNHMFWMKDFPFLVRKAAFPQYRLDSQSLTLYNYYGRLIPYPVYVKKVPDMGSGLFADRQIEKGELIAIYTGQIRDLSYVAIHDPQNEYIVDIYPGRHQFQHFMICPQEFVSFAHFANHSKKAPNSQLCLIWSEEGLAGVLLPLRRIQKDEQIFWNYGDNYGPAKNWK